MVAVAREFIASTELNGIFEDGQPECTIVFEIDGLLCKARPDWLAKDRKISLSYKTTKGSASPNQWIRTQLPGYDTGIRLYEWGIRLAANIDETRVVTLVQEQQEPYSCSLIALAPAWEALADAKLNEALTTWAACLKTGKFPAYPSAIAWAEPKPWMLDEVEEREIGNAYDPKEMFGNMKGKD